MLKALVVEDDLELAGLIKAALEKKGLKVKVLHCLKPALELIEQETFSLAIVDRVLPDVMICEQQALTTLYLARNYAPARVAPDVVLGKLNVCKT